MTEKTKVEKYRLTSQQMSYQKNFKKLLRVGQILKKGIAENMAKGATLGQMFQEVTQGLTQMRQAAPQDPMQELVGQTPEAGGAQTPESGGLQF